MSRRSRRDRRSQRAAARDPLADPRRPEPARRVLRAFRDRHGAWPRVIAWAPGRVNLIGEHTDYNEGLALPAAIDRWIAVAIGPGSGEVYSLDMDATWRVGEPVEAAGGWARYARGALEVFRAARPFQDRFDVVFGGDVPLGSGLSSSAALTVAWMNALRAWTRAPIDDATLVRLAQAVEHQHLGVMCGLLDQTASQMAVPGHAIRVDFSDLSVQQIPADLGDLALVLLHTGVHRELAGSAYQDRVRECREGLAHVQASRPEVSGFADLEVPHLDTDTTWGRRLRHVVTENVRVDAAAAALTLGRPRDLGPLLFASHASLRGDYAVSCDELDWFVDFAAEHPAALGARMVGGGFGGCALALVEADRADDFSDAALAGYRGRFPHTPSTLRFSLVGGAVAQRMR